MNTLAGAIQTWWQATQPGLSADGRVWFKVAPQESALPYATFFQVSDVVGTWTTNYPFKQASVQFNFHAITAAAAEQLGESFRALFRGAPLIVGSGLVCHVLPNGSGIDIGEGLGPNGQDCWIAFELFDIAWTP